MAAGHHSTYLKKNPESTAYLDSLVDRRSDPEIYHTTTEMSFVRLDIAKFTQLPARLQPRAIAEIHELVIDALPRAENSTFMERRVGDEWTFRDVLHTGDGFIIANDVPKAPSPYPVPLYYAKEIARAMDKANSARLPIHFRISVTLGPVYVTGDLAGHRNYVGSTINESERLLSCLPKNLDDVVCFSYGVYRKFIDRMGEFDIFRFGSVVDKNDEAHRIYLLEYAK